MGRLRPLMTGSLALLAISASAAQAQRASIAARATVADVRVASTAMKELRFGIVPPGAVVSVDARTSPSAGMLKLEAADGTEFSFALQLPSELWTDDAQATLPIEFGPNAVCQRGLNGAQGCRYFDPADTVRTRGARGAPVETAVYVQLGGTVALPAAQRPGVYEGVATASVAFTAN